MAFTLPSRGFDTVKLRELLDEDWRAMQRVSCAPDRPRPFLSFLNPRFAPVHLLRLSRAAWLSGWPRLAKFWSLANALIFGLEATPRLSIGPGLVLPHANGTVLGAGRIGANVVIFHQVTLGAATADFAYDSAKRPQVDDGVTISAGAKIVGPVTLGRGCVVGANAVVLQDVPPDMLAVGVPAVIKGRGARK